MWIIKQDSIKPIKKMHVENNEYIIHIEYIEEENFKDKRLSHTKIISRFCKAKKNGDIVINFYKQKIKTNINQIKD
jgi:hypothetical protein